VEQATSVGCVCAFYVYLCDYPCPVSVSPARNLLACAMAAVQGHMSTRTSPLALATGIPQPQHWSIQLIPFPFFCNLVLKLIEAAEGPEGGGGGLDVGDERRLPVQHRDRDGTLTSLKGRPLRFRLFSDAAGSRLVRTKVAADQRHEGPVQAKDSTMSTKYGGTVGMNQPLGKFVGFGFCLQLSHGESDPGPGMMMGQGRPEFGPDSQPSDSDTRQRVKRSSKVCSLQDKGSVLGQRHATIGQAGESVDKRSNVSGKWPSFGAWSLIRAHFPTPFQISGYRIALQTDTGTCTSTPFYKHIQVAASASKRDVSTLGKALPTSTRSFPKVACQWKEGVEGAGWGGGMAGVRIVLVHAHGLRSQSEVYFFFLSFFFLFAHFPLSKFRPLHDGTELQHITCTHWSRAPPGSSLSQTASMPLIRQDTQPPITVPDCL
jgi:hypothetical protein